MSRLDALAVRESNGKSYFTKIGAAFPNKSGNGYSILLDAIPAPVEGQFKILLREPMERDQSAHNQAKGNGYQRQPNSLDDDASDIPF